MSLFTACQTADLDQIRTLLHDKTPVDQLDNQGRTALHYCAEHLTSECAQLLLQHASDRNNLLNIQDNEGCSALHLACLNGNLTMVTFFCEQGVDIQLVDKEGHSLIHWVTVCGHLHLFDILTRYQAPIHTADIYGAYPIHYAAQLSAIENNDEQTFDRDQARTILRKFIDYHVDVNCLDDQRRTPFLWAASVGAIEALHILHEAGANPFHVDKDGLNALHCAATHGHAECLRVLIQSYRCALEGEDINGCTALFYAVTMEHNQASQVLFDFHANANHQDTRGRTPSHCAAVKGNLDCLKRLIKAKADIWMRNKRGDYPIQEAVTAVSLSKQRPMTKSLGKKCAELIRYVFKLYPKKVNICNGEHRTSLHLAAGLGDISMCQVLIECGARVNALVQTTAGNFLTPYDLARIHRHDVCADYLLYHHGGHRGNFLVHIFARRIQRCFRCYRTRRSMKSERETKDLLLSQAKICLDNKRLDDRSTRLHSNYLVDPNAPVTDQRRRTYAKSRTPTSSSSERIIIHRSNSIATSVKLYERHKLIAEELFRLKQARLQNHLIVINRPLYKILIENAFNPQSRQAEEIEAYLEKLLKAYEAELEDIRKRTKSVPARRTRAQK